MDAQREGTFKDVVVGVQPGTLVIADRAYDGQLKCQHQDVVLGKVRTTTATFDRQVAEDILSQHTDKSYDAVIGSTLGTQDFYEGTVCTQHYTVQARARQGRYAMGDLLLAVVLCSHWTPFCEVFQRTVLILPFPLFTLMVATVLQGYTKTLCYLGEFCSYEHGRRETRKTGQPTVALKF